MMRLMPLLLILTVLVPSSAHPEITEGGTGLLFGDDHAFKFTAPQGWVLDNQSAVQQGQHMVFYPVGQTWSNSPVMAYGQSATKGSDLHSVEDQVKRTLDEFHREGSAEYTAQAKDEQVLSDGRKAQVYLFRGDQWGNYEVVGYVEEEASINFLVYNARSKEEFEKHLPAFATILSTYKNMFARSKAEDGASFGSLVAEAKASERTMEGASYNSQVITSFGSSLANIMKSCTSYTTKGASAAHSGESGRLFRRKAAA